MNITKEQLLVWDNNRLINPITKRKIKESGSVYKKILNKYNEIIKENKVSVDKKVSEDDIKEKYIDNYKDFRKNKIDPLIHEQLPFDKMTEKDLFIFPYKWNPYTGERLEIDENGPLYFDPDTLIRYFYVNRINNLWFSEKSGFQGYYGNAVGNGPDFNIKGRGDHRNWYLFRLPIPDGYLDINHCHQSVTMGPILTDKEIKEIYCKAKHYKKNYRKLYKRSRPNLEKMNNYYKLAISKNPLNLNIDIIDKEYFDQVSYIENTNNIKLLYKI